jgi:ribonucleoside-diphosphate reductase alpha chain
VDSYGNFNFDSFRLSIRAAVRFLDDVLSINEYPLPEIRENCNNVRRIGLGIMGLHTALIKMGMSYSSLGAKIFTDELFAFLKEEAYKASVDLAIEKGPFPAYAPEFLESGFTRRALSASTRKLIRENGIRNCALLTIAPTGTTGMVSNVSTGIEPLFAPAYWRRFFRPTEDGSRKLDKELVIDPLWGELESEGKSVDILEGAYDIKPEQHFEMQKIAQNHIDNAVSKTINMPMEYTVDNLADLWLEYLPHVKGSTFYRAGSRGEEPYQQIPLAEAKKLLALKTETHEALINEQNSMDCVGDACAIPEDLRPSIDERTVQIAFA